MATPDITAWNAKILDVNSNPISLKSIITDLTSPVLEKEFDTDKRAGEIGVISRPLYFNEMESSFTIKKATKPLMQALLAGIGDPNGTITLQATAIVDNGTTRESYIWDCIGYVSSLPLGDLSADGVDAEVTMMVNKLDVAFGVDFAMSYDPENYVYSINGTNLWADVASVIG